MGPTRGFKRRRRVKRKAEKYAAAGEPMDSSQESADWWDAFSRRITGPLSLSKGLNKFESIFKISRKTFNYICSLVREDLLAKTTFFTCSDGKVLSVEDQVAVAIRRLCSGDSLSSVGILFGMNQSTIAQVTWRFVEAMEARGMHHLRWPNSEEMEIIKSKFEMIQGLPNCCGAIDTTHIMMCQPSADPSNKVWLDHQKKYSMVLQAIVDPDMRFRDIVTGWPGCMNDFLVLQNSDFFQLCERDLRLNGKKLELSGGSEVREYIIGDVGFPLLPWLLTPYQGKDLSDSKTEFNWQHSATRMVAQRALARLKDTWKIIHGEMWRPDKLRLPRIILVCCLLHNIVIDLEDGVQDEMPLCHQHDPNYKQQFCNFADQKGLILREELSQFLSQRLPS